MPLSREDIKKIALRTIAILKDGGYDCCLFGSAACAAWGMTNRVPNDVDVVVLTQDDKEEIKRKITAADNKFYLIRPKNPSDTFRVLWYRIRPGVSCKVDILLPGLLNIPPIPTHLIEIQDELPVMPFLPLLLLKVQGWFEHEKDERWHVRSKIRDDYRDIDEMLGTFINDSHRLDANEWLPAAFIDTSREQVKAFVLQREYTKERWNEIGFDV